MRIIKVKTCSECPYLNKNASCGEWCEDLSLYIENIDTTKSIPKICRLPKLEI